MSEEEILRVDSGRRERRRLEAASVHVSQGYELGVRAAAAWLKTAGSVVGSQRMVVDLLDAHGNDGAHGTRHSAEATSAAAADFERQSSAATADVQSLMVSVTEATTVADVKLRRALLEVSSCMARRLRQWSDALKVAAAEYEEDVAQ
jgi:hypothetical protein